MSLWRTLRTYVITPPFSAFCFAAFWCCSIAYTFARASKTRMHALGRYWSRFLLRTAGIRVRTEGLDQIDPQGTYIYVANHRSLADTPVTSALLPTCFRYMAKESLLRVPIIGGHLRRGAHIGVPREDARGAARALARAAELLRSGEASVLIFAEGTRGTGAVQAFKSGAAHLAVQTGVPVVPIGIAGTQDVLPRGAPLLRPGVVALVAGAPIPTAGLGPKDRDSLTALLQEGVGALVDRAEALRDI